MTLAAVVAASRRARDRPASDASTNGREGLVRAAARPRRLGRWLAAGSTSASAQHKRYKEDVKRSGKPFFPYAMFHDTVMSLVVVTVIIGLACVWYFTAERPRRARLGLLGPHYTEPGRPGNDELRAAAGLVLLLPLLPAADLQVARFGHPRRRSGSRTSCSRSLIALPFIDLRRERRLLRRPVAIIAAILVVLSMGMLTYKGATAQEALGSEIDRGGADLGGAAGLRGQRGGGRRGRALRELRAALQCHTYLGTGSAQPRRAGPHRRSARRAAGQRTS